MTEPIHDEEEALRQIAEIQRSAGMPLPEKATPWGAVWRGFPIRADRNPGARGPRSLDTQYDAARARWANFYRMNVSLPGCRKNKGLIAIQGVLEAVIQAVCEKESNGERIKRAQQLMFTPLYNAKYYETHDSDPSWLQVKRLVIKVARLLAEIDKKTSDFI